MAPSFGRSISFPLSPARSFKPRAAACHVRSISLPCRSHPLLAHLQTQIAAVRSWATSPTAPSSGLAHIDALHAVLAELLVLPEVQDAVCGATPASDRLLDAYILLADAHRGFQETLLALKRDVADVRAALRRRDAARLASAARSQRRNEKELARHAAAVSSGTVAKCARLGLGGATAEETEIAVALMEAAAASAAASATVFSAAASMSAAASSSKTTAAFAAFAKKAAPETTEVVPEKLVELEKCIDECESGSEMVFRSIVRTRVSLLNIRTPAI
ncbi:uncharacterized protein LOC133883480 [Phragmites australis]|uniref:uncharacterized protein LOC133883480 n=1 Tax=Phragmites australis TaxID=29695 RepID=UPI002D779DFC|nr:uncharacterized protein LOC133883480 [Phragmites australis]